MGSCRLAHISAFISVFAIPCLAVARPATFMGLGDLPGDPHWSQALGISPDGGTVVGVGDYSASGFSEFGHAFRWTADTGVSGLGVLAGVPNTFAYGVSLGGTVVIGTGLTPEQTEVAFRWTEASGMLPLANLGGTESAARGVSWDGSVIVGLSTSSSGREACRWVGADPPMTLGILPGGILSDASAVSADGTVVVGYSHTRVGNRVGIEAFRWTEATGMVGLGGLPGGRLSDRANAVSADGALVVGYAAAATDSHAFRWSQSTGMIDLGTLPVDPFRSRYSTALGVSDNSVIVGQSASGSSWEAFIWDETHGMRSLRDVLTQQYGIDLDGWFLAAATAITSDGQIIAGYGANPEGRGEAWIVQLPEPGALALFALGCIGLICYRPMWRPCSR